VPLFCAGGIATPADAALTMQLGAEGNFVGSGIFKSEDPERRARAIVEATTHFNDPERVAAASSELGEPMRGDDIAELPPGSSCSSAALAWSPERVQGETDRLRVGVLASQGDFGARTDLRLAPKPSRFAPPTSSPTSTPVIPGRSAAIAGDRPRRAQ
jgi:hypothetical protein